MKNGSALLGGVVLGALVGVGVGYLLGVDSEKKQHWLKLLNEKILRRGCCCGEDCDCGDDCTCGCKDKDKDKEAAVEKA